MATTNKLFSDDIENDNIIIDEIINDKTQPQLSTTTKWRRGKFLGKGGFAKVYELINIETSKIYASKIVPKSTLQKTRQRAKI